MSNPAPQLVQKLWNYCNMGSLAPARSGLRPSAPQNPFRSPAGGSSLKMADEQSRPPFNPPSPGYGGTGKPSAVRKGNWSALTVIYFIAIFLSFSVTVSAAEPPRVILIGPEIITNECHVPFVDPGVRISAGPVAVAAGAAHSLALKADGTVVAWGLNHVGQTNVPAHLSRVVAIAASAFYSLALTADGSVVSWGEGPYGYGDPKVPPSVKHEVTAIAAAYYHAAALRADDSIIMWGTNIWPPEFEVPTTATNVVALAAGGSHTLALRRDGTLVGWGFAEYGQNAVPQSATNVVAIADSGKVELALRADGTIVKWGLDDQFHQLSVPARATNIVAITANDLICAAVRADGVPFVWGLDYSGRAVVIPPSATNIVGIAVGGDDYCLALRADGAVLGWGDNSWGQCTPPPNLTIQDLPWSVSSDLNTDAPGTYTLTYSATNILGEIGIATRTVVVRDTTPPKLICPNLVVKMTEIDGAVVEFSSRATDLCSGTVFVSCNPPSGSKFPLGTNVVVCTATDASGNSAQSNFTVTVMGGQTAKMNVLAEMTMVAESQGRQFDQAIRSLTRSLNTNQWLGEMQLAPKFGGKVFSAEAQTVLLLSGRQIRYSNIPKATVQDWITRLVRVDQMLAERQIEIAIEMGVSPKKLRTATQMLAQGNIAFGNGHPTIAITFYQRAWAMTVAVTKKFAGER